ncbi:integrase core domain-containing protein [Maioricimonas sp. JC845]|uniref:integrase core domain-containing protein n=1 Tax=Maioricimonas sp. JC845 TaxID=3232138 RepID=UPI00345AAEB4
MPTGCRAVGLSWGSGGLVGLRTAGKPGAWCCVGDIRSGRRLTARYQQEYNTVRPHSSLGYVGLLPIF